MEKWFYDDYEMETIWAEDFKRNGGVLAPNGKIYAVYCPGS